MTKELVGALFFLIFMTVLTLFDVLADLAEGSGWEHVGLEIGVIIVGTFGVLGILRHILQFYKTAIQRSEADRARLAKQAESWKQEAQSLLKGLSVQIDRQFSLWQLTPAEKEVALLLIKGFSQKDIAQIRGVQEKTVRLQCSALYKKSNLTGRAELSAFFLEDLLLPIKAD